MPALHPVRRSAALTIENHPARNEQSLTLSLPPPKKVKYQPTSQRDRQGNGTSKARPQTGRILHPPKKYFHNIYSPLAGCVRGDHRRLSFNLGGERVLVVAPGRRRPPRLTHAGAGEGKVSKGKNDQGNGLAGRKPRLKLRSPGKKTARPAERQLVAPLTQLPPRMTRKVEPEVATGLGPAASGLP